MISLLTSRFGLFPIAIIIGLSSLWGFGRYQYHLGFQAAENMRHIADLESFKSESIRLQGISQDLERKLAALREAQPKIIERYNRVIVEKPLPVDCIIDSERLRELNTTISTANSSKPSQPMSGSR